MMVMMMAMVINEVVMMIHDVDDDGTALEPCARTQVFALQSRRAITIPDIAGQGV